MTVVEQLTQLDDITIRTVRYRVTDAEPLYEGRDPRKGIRFVPDQVKLVFTNGALTLVSIHGQRLTRGGVLHASYRGVWNWPFQRSDALEEAPTLLKADPPWFVLKLLTDLSWDPDDNLLHTET